MYANKNDEDLQSICSAIFKLTWETQIVASSTTIKEKFYISIKRMNQLIEIIHLTYVFCESSCFGNININKIFGTINV